MGYVGKLIAVRTDIVVSKPEVGLFFAALTSILIKEIASLSAAL